MTEGEISESRRDLSRQTSCSALTSLLSPAESLKEVVLPSASMRIVTACDESYAMPLATALRSLVDANRSGRLLEIFVLSSQFTQQTKEKVGNSLPQGSAQVRWLNVDIDSFRDLSTLPHISTMTFARTLLPYCFPSSTSRLLYLDADILVLGDLSALWETDLEGNAFGAVVDSHSFINAKRLGLTTGIKGESAGVMAEYFNAGVLLVDLQKWRQEQVSEQAINYLVDNPRSLLADQDALNISSGGRWKRLDSRWNCLHHPAGGFYKMQPEQRPSIIHYAGRGKPWFADSLSVDELFYDSFRNRTLFAKSVGERSRDLAVHWWACAKAFARRHGITELVRGCLTRRRPADCL
jgi:lipopolysaccharide biosynthesis glycosyltransferase